MEPSVNSITIRVDKKQADEFLSLNTLSFQRNLRQSHVRHLALMMLRNTFGQGTINFAVTPSGTYLINGQHTLSAISLSGITQVLTIIYHHVSYEEIPTLYASFDRNLTRSHADIISMYDIFPDEPFSKSFIGYISSGLDLVATGFSPDTYHGRYITNLMRSSAVRAELVREWGEEARSFYYDVYSLFGGLTAAQRAMFSRKAVISVSLVTYRYNKTVARDFWGGAVMDDRLQRGDPRKTLVYFLMNSPRMAYDHHVYCKYVALAWNAFYRKRNITVLRLYEESRLKPIDLEGTPHKRQNIMAYIDAEGKILHTPIDIDKV